MITCPVLRHLNGRNRRVSGDEPELPEPVKDLVRYPHGDAVAAPRLATSNAPAAGRGTDSRCPDAAAWARMTVTASSEQLTRGPGNRDHAAIQPGALPGPARPKASDSLIKGRAERPDRRHLDLVRRRARPEADRRVRVRVAPTTGSRSVIDIRLTDRRRERPQRPCPAARTSRPHNGSAQTNGGPDAPHRGNSGCSPKWRRCINIRPGRLPAGPVTGTAMRRATWRAPYHRAHLAGRPVRSAAPGAHQLRPPGRGGSVLSACLPRGAEH